MSHITVAIDGPSGVGKSSLAQLAAKELGYIYMDTGTMYRTVGVYAMNKLDDLEDIGAIVALLPEVPIEEAVVKGKQDNKEIRTPKASYAASRVAKIPEVRTFLVNKQREMAKSNDLIMDGRDIGTVVLPNATVKIYLTASLEERARRRFVQLKELGSAERLTLNQIIDDVNQRDYEDSNRAASPLKQAEDAILLDTTDLSKEESLAKLLEIIAEKVGQINQ